MDPIDRETLVKIIEILQQQIKNLQDQITSLNQRTEIMHNVILAQNKVTDAQYECIDIRLDALGRHCFGTINPPTSEDPESGMDLEPEICWPSPDAFDMRDANERNHQ